MDSTVGGHTGGFLRDFELGGNLGCRASLEIGVTGLPVCGGGGFFTAGHGCFVDDFFGLGFFLATTDFAAGKDFFPSFTLQGHGHACKTFLDVGALAVDRRRIGALAMDKALTLVGTAEIASEDGTNSLDTTDELATLVVAPVRG